MKTNTHKIIDKAKDIDNEGLIQKYFQKGLMINSFNPRLNKIKRKPFSLIRKK
jgi:hypothetical protein